MKRKENKIKSQEVKPFLPDSNSAEAFRTLRTNIQFSISTDESFSLLVTSSFQGEGKSWNSSNIANVFAAQGKKTLLIDADLRKGVQEKTGIFNRQPGVLHSLRSCSSAALGSYRLTFTRCFPRCNQILSVPFCRCNNL